MEVCDFCQGTGYEFDVEKYKREQAENAKWPDGLKRFIWPLTKPCRNGCAPPAITWPWRWPEEQRDERTIGPK